MNETACELCGQDGGEVVYRQADFRVVLVEDKHYPGFCRVIWNEHVSEMTDLTPPQRSSLMQAVCKVEAAIREVMQPDKVNLAALGNMTPHLHWHVIPRYREDLHFPSPIWAQTQRWPVPADIAARRALLPALRAAIARHFSTQA
ncbi:MAG: HIT family protein [Proteobacteria bacterium]|nr:HIT family protein [Pseudomonadota bacterium]